MKPIKVVVDTNVFINAIFHNDKSCQRILQYNNENKIKFCFNEYTNSELYYIVGQLIQKLMQGKDVSRMLSRFGKMMYDIEKIEHKTKTNYSEDKSDNNFIDCCIDGQAKYLITNDIHLENARDSIKEIKEKYGLELKIVSPLQFSMEMLRLKFKV